MLIVQKAAIVQPTLVLTVLGFRGSLFQLNGGRCRATALQGVADAHRLAGFCATNDAAHSGRAVRAISIGNPIVKR